MNLTPEMTTRSKIEAGRKERIRRRIVNLVFLFYLLLIFEGAIRKWIFPQYHRFIFFARDPIVLYIYWLAFKYKFWPDKPRVFKYSMFLAKLAILLIVIQVAVTQSSFISLLYGWRMWFFYIPFAFIVGEVLTLNDIKRLIRWTLIIAIPMALLVVKQARSPIQSFWNRTVEEGVFYSLSGPRGGDVTRVTATFTFFHSWQIFLGSVITFCLISWVLPKNERPIKLVFLILATFAAMASFAVDVTRLPTILAILAAGGCVLSGMVMKDRKKRLRAEAFSVILIVSGAIIASSLFAFIAMRRTSRFENKAYLQERISGMFMSGTVRYDRLPVFGIGLGAGSRGGSLIGGAKGGAENEWENHLREGGIIFGLMYIIFRIRLVWWLFKNAVRATRISSNPIPLVLFAFSGPIILIWYMTIKGQTHAFGWLLAGLCIAANHLADKKEEAKQLPGGTA